jgi:predicted HD phosphohydrolase
MRGRVAASVEEVLSLYDRWAEDPYDEAVSQLEHALQTAELAADADAPDPLVAAALLHDVGHLLDLEAGGAGRPEGDLRHEATGARYLAGVFGPDVTGPVALHVSAKRYLCADPTYASGLSPGSAASLLRQGGPLRDAERASFDAHPRSADALALRRWDDAGKVLDVTSGAMAAWAPLLRSVARSSPPVSRLRR